MPLSSHATIAGASVAGLAVACRLVAAGWSVAVLERRADLLEGGRALLIQPNGLAALEQLGALDRVAERGFRLSRVVQYGVGGRRLAEYDYAELRHPHPYVVEIRPGELRTALAERLAELGGTPPRLECEVTGLVQGGAGVRYRAPDGEEREEHAACTIGADGAGSAVREGLGIRCRHIAGRDTYVLGTVALDRSQDEVELHCGRGFCNGVVPLRDGTYFWDHVTEENGEAVGDRDLGAWRETYVERVPSAADVAAAISAWEQLTVVDVRPFWAQSGIADGAALVGDAAGVVHPHSAQGANLALEGAVLLADAVVAHDGPPPVPRAALAAHARRLHRKLRRYVLWSVFSARALSTQPARRGARCAASGTAGTGLAPRGARCCGRRRGSVRSRPSDPRCRA